MITAAELKYALGAMYDIERSFRKAAKYERWVEYAVLICPHLCAGNWERVFDVLGEAAEESNKLKPL